MFTFAIVLRAWSNLSFLCWVIFIHHIQVLSADGNLTLINMYAWNYEVIT